MKFYEKIKECKIKFNNKFIYEDSKPCKVIDHMLIVCPIHGEFTQELRVHLRSEYGCPKCAYEGSSLKQKQSTEDFIEKAKQKHGSRYDYSKTNYTGDKKKVIIICKIHGEFTQDPYTHIDNRGPCGCPKCGEDSMKKKQTRLISDLETTFVVNNKNVTADFSTYVNSKTKVSAVCIEHGAFKQTLAILKDSYGCPKCASLFRGWNRSIYEGIPVRLYCLHLHTGTFKIGITKTDIKTRYGIQEALNIKEVLFERVFEEGTDAWEIEKKVLTALKSHKYEGSPIFKYTGITEIFTINPVETIQKEITKWLQI